MNFDELIGQTFHENQIYEMLHFEIEQNFKNYFSKFIHIYFEHLDAGQICILEIVYLADEKTMYITNRQILGTKGWLEIYHHSKHMELMICRKDRSGKFSVMGPSMNHTQTFQRADFTPLEITRELTPEEERAAFAELAGMFDEHVQLSKPKIAV